MRSLAARRLFGLWTVFVVCAVLVAGVTGAAFTVGLRWSRAALTEQVQEAERLLANERADQLASSLDQMRFRLEALAEQPLFSDGIHDPGMGRLRAFLAAAVQLPGVASYTVYDTDGELVVRVPEATPEVTGDRPVAASPDRRDALIRYSADMRGTGGTVVGRLEQAISVQELLPTWASRAANTGGQVTLVHTDGEILISAVPKPEPRLRDEALLAAVESGRPRLLSYDATRDERHIAALAPVGRAGLVVIADEPVTEAYAAAQRLTLRMGLLLAACLVILTLIGLAVARMVHGMRRRIDAERAAAETLAHSDPLTGLANRRALELAVGSARGRITVAAVDVDGLKEVNDRFGHGAGDDALRRMATALRGPVRPGDIVARTGGDEFVLVWMDSSDDLQPSLEARLRRALGELASSEEAHPLRASVGLATGTPNDFIELLAVADEHCYAEKRVRKDHSTEPQVV